MLNMQSRTGDRSPDDVPYIDTSRPTGTDRERIAIRAEEFSAPRQKKTRALELCESRTNLPFRT